MRRPRGVVILDFDGTVTLRDVGDAICERFAPPAWREVDAAWARGEISLPEAQRRIWSMVRATREEALAVAREGDTLRPGLDALLHGAAARGVEVWLASGGFDFYIERILAGLLGRFDRTFYNRAVFVRDRVQLAFSHPQLACERCAICKGRVCDLAREAGLPVLLAGDGLSDRCGAGRADVVAAVRGSVLAERARAAGLRPIEFDALDELLPALF